MADNDTDNEIAPLDHDDLLKEVVMALVDEHDAVKVAKRYEEDRNFLQLTITVAPSERGKVIGKQGATLALLRSLFMRIGAADNRLVIGVDIDSDGQAPRPRRV